nr:MAG TPA: hypothetical protein [Caudoviricetes sp.]
MTPRMTNKSNKRDSSSAILIMEYSSTEVM